MKASSDRRKVKSTRKGDNLATPGDNPAGSRHAARNWFVPATVFVVGLVAVSLGLWRRQLSQKPLGEVEHASSSRGESADSQPRTRSADEIPIPDDLDTLESALVERIQERVQAVRERRDDPEARGRLGIVYEAHGFPDLAMSCYAKAFALDPSTARWRYHWGVLASGADVAEGAEQAFRDVIARKPDYAPAHERLGLLLLEREAFEQAEEAFQRVVELRPGEAPGYVDLARVLLAVGRYSEAVDPLTQALSLAPTWDTAHYLLGRAYQGQGRLEEAKVEFARGARSTPSFVFDPWRSDIARAAVGRKAMLRIARSFLGVGRVEEALKKLEELISRDPTDAEVANELATTYLRLRRYNDARRVLLPALHAHAELYVLHVKLAGVLMGLGDLEGALEQANEAVRVAPNAAQTSHVRGVVLAGLGRNDEALSAYRRALELDPAAPRVHQDIGRILMRMGRWVEAVGPWEAAVDRQPQSWFNHYNLGLVYERIGRAGDSVEALRAALALNPGDQRVQRALDRSLARRGGG